MYGVAYEPDTGGATTKDGVMCCVTGCGRPADTAGLGVEPEGKPEGVAGLAAGPLNAVGWTCRCRSMGMVNGPGGFGSGGRSALTACIGPLRRPPMRSSSCATCTIEGRASGALLSMLCTRSTRSRGSDGSSVCNAAGA